MHILRRLRRRRISYGRAVLRHGQPPGQAGAYVRSPRTGAVTAQPQRPERGHAPQPALFHPAFPRSGGHPRHLRHVGVRHPDPQPVFDLCRKGRYAPLLRTGAPRPDSRHTRRGCRRLCRNVHRVLPPGAPVRPCGEPQAGTRGLRLEQYPARRTREHLPAHQTPVSARLCQHHALLLRGRKPAGLHPADRHVARSLRTDEANAEPQYPQVLRQHHLLRAERRLQPELPPR